MPLRNDLHLQAAMSRVASGSSLPSLASGLSDGESAEAAAHRKAAAGARTLMTFRGCTQRMGNTILLKVGIRLVASSLVKV